MDQMLYHSIYFVENNMENNKFVFRFAVAEDAKALSDIYAYYVRETPISFEYTPPTPQEFSERIKKISTNYPYLVCEHNGKPVGYAYASEFKARIAYQWDAETSIYIDKEYHRMHIASAFYRLLLKMLQMHGLYKAYALITVPNEASESLHRKAGFETIGIFRQTGFKLNEWRDVAFMEKNIADVQAKPSAPFAITDLDQSVLKQLLASENAFR